MRESLAFYPSRKSIRDSGWMAAFFLAGAVMFLWFFVRDYSPTLDCLILGLFAAAELLFFGLFLRHYLFMRKRAADRTHVVKLTSSALIVRDFFIRSIEIPWDGIRTLLATNDRNGGVSIFVEGDLGKLESWIKISIDASDAAPINRALQDGGYLLTRN